METRPGCFATLYFLFCFLLNGTFAFNSLCDSETQVQTFQSKRILHNIHGYEGSEPSRVVWDEHDEVWF